jgi:hypothetical protein
MEALLTLPRSWSSLVSSMRNLTSKSRRSLQTISKSTATMIYLRYVSMPPQHPSYIVLTCALPKMPRVRQLPISTYFDPNPLPGYGSDAQPKVETLVEDIMPTQPTDDESIVKFWYPSQAGLGPISHASGPLLLRISKMTKTQIKVQGARGLRISAQHMDHIDEAMDILDSLEECLVWS